MERTAGRTACITPTLTKPDGKMVICGAVIARTRWQARVEGANVARRVDETYEE